MLTGTLGQYNTIMWSLVTGIKSLLFGSLLCCSSKVNAFSHTMNDKHNSFFPSTNLVARKLQSILISGITGALVVSFIRTDIVNAADATPASYQASYGIKDGRLLKCNVKSNCVSTTSINSLDKYARPWTYTKPTVDEFNELLNVLRSDPYLKVVEQDNGQFYIRAEAKSGFPPTGVDDIEFLFNEKDNIIAYRGNSREVVVVGTSEVVSDGGAIRNRLSSIQRKLGLKEMGMDAETEAYIKNTNELNFFQQLQKASQPSDINFVDNSVPEQ